VRALGDGHKPSDEDNRPYDRTTVRSHTGPADGTDRNLRRPVPTTHGSVNPVTAVNDRAWSVLVGQDEQRRTRPSRSHHANAVGRGDSLRHCTGQAESKRSPTHMELLSDGGNPSITGRRPRHPRSARSPERRGPSHVGR
jgi:hypothetical protein